MKEPYERGVANHSAPSFAPSIARCVAKRKQGHSRAGYRASKNCNWDADAVVKAEGNMVRSDIASFRPVLRSRRPHARLETPCTRTGRPRRRLKWHHALRANINETFLAAGIREQGEKELIHDRWSDGWVFGDGHAGSGSDAEGEAAQLQCFV